MGDSGANSASDASGASNCAAGDALSSSASLIVLIPACCISAFCCTVSSCVGSGGTIRLARSSVVESAADLAAGSVADSAANSVSSGAS